MCQFLIRPHQKAKCVEVTYASVNEDGLVDLTSFRKALSKKTVLVTFAYANSEIGVIQPVQKITRAVRVYEREHNICIYAETHTLCFEGQKRAQNAGFGLIKQTMVGIEVVFSISEQVGSVQRAQK